METLTMKQALDAYRGKRVFITGHTGFKGSWLSLILLKLGAEVYGFALDPISDRCHFNLLGLKESLAGHKIANICNAAELYSQMNSFKPDVVFHLAAQALVRNSYIDPLGTYNTNVIGSANLLEAVKRVESVKSLVYITSDKCYENKEWVWGYRESDQLGGHDPYSSSKACAELVFSTYKRSFFNERVDLGVATARAGNVIGGGDWSPDRIVPDCIRAIEAGIPINLRNPYATRPWQHVLEPLSGYILLGANLLNDPVKYSDSWNFGPPSTDTRNVGSVASTIYRICGRDFKQNNTSYPSEFHEAQLLQLNCDYAHSKLGWAPRWNVDKTLEMTGAWYSKILSGEFNSAVSTDQIEEYFSEYVWDSL